MNNPWNPILKPSQDISARRIDHTHPLDIFWARDYRGRYLFVYEFVIEDNISNIKLPSLIGIQSFYSLAKDEMTKNSLVLLLNEQSNWEIFYALCNDLVQATREAKNVTFAVQIILRRLARWQEFLKNKRNEILSEEEIKGLIGELLFIKNHLMPKFGVVQAILFWQGPEGLSQDFNIDQSAIEVKCQSGGTRPYIRISSANQLCSQLPEMYLFIVTLGKTAPNTPDLINLPSLISYIREALQSISLDQVERFNDLLYQAGYLDSDRYLEFNYILIDESMFQITEGFPRICPDALHAGITHLSYDISLSACVPYTGRPDWMDA